MQRSDIVIDKCDNLIKTVYNKLGEKNDTLNSTIKKMIDNIEVMLSEQRVGERQVIIEKILGETSALLAKDLDQKRDVVYEGMRYILKRYYEVEPENEDDEREEQGKTRSLLEEHTEANQVSLTTIEFQIEDAISNTIGTLARMGYQDSVLEQVEMNSKEIRDKAIRTVGEEITRSNKEVKEIITETLNEVFEQSLKEYTEEEKPWQLSSEQEAEFRKGEHTVLKQYETEKLPIRDASAKKEIQQLSVDDIF